MENGTEVKEVVEVVAPDKVEESSEADSKMQMVTGVVQIAIDKNGGLQVSAPPNQLIALAIIEAGKAFITMAMQDGMRRAQAVRPPTIVRPGVDALSKISRPS